MMTMELGFLPYQKYQLKKFFFWCGSFEVEFSLVSGSGRMVSF
jgi:hypothetical protein